MDQLTHEEMTALGEYWAKDLMLKKDPDHSNRYLTASGSSTALGIYYRLNKHVYDRHEDIKVLQSRK